MADQTTGIELTQQELGIQFEDILPWGSEGGDTGLTSRLKLKRNFEKIKAWMDSRDTGPWETVTDEETGMKTAHLKSEYAGAWTDGFLSALGKGSGGGSDSGIILNEPLKGINEAGLAAPALAQKDMTLVWNGSRWVYGKTGAYTFATGDENGTFMVTPYGGQAQKVKIYGLKALAYKDTIDATLVTSGIFSADRIPGLSWSKITSDKPTTLAGYGIGDAKIVNGTITLGGNSITPVTEVKMTVPTGFAVTGSPLTKTGTLALAYAAGYEGFTTALKEKIEALFSWFELDSDGNVKTKDKPNGGGHRGFWTESFVSALGKNDSQSSVFDESAMWTALGGSLTNKQIALSHLTTALSGYVKGVKVGSTTYSPNSSGIVDLGTIEGRTYTFAPGATNGTFKVTPSVGDAYEVAIKGLRTLAYKSELTAEDIPDIDATKITTGILSADRIPGLSADKITSGTLSVDRIPDLSGKYVTTTFFNKLFRAQDASGNDITVNASTAVDSIKAMVGLWTEEYLSALGKNPAQGEVVVLNALLTALNGSGLAGHPSQSGQTVVWNGSQWTFGTAGGSGTVTAVKVGSTTYSPTNGVVSLPAYPTSLAWGNITGKPTTIGDYGITDAKIENGVITLGANTITPLTDAKLKSSYEWWGQKMNADGKVNGNITIQLTTVDTNTYADANPKLIFKNANGSQNISLTFTDYDAVAYPASLTLNGNQGNELFIAPRMKADRLYLYKPNGNGDTNAVYLEYDSANGGVHLVGAGFYSDSFVSALGKSDSGSSSVFDEDSMWQALGTNRTNKLIASAYLGNVTKTLTIKDGNGTTLGTYNGTAAQTITINDMAAKQLTASTIDGTAGSFFFYGDNLINNQYDWVGIQVDNANKDRGQLVWCDNTLMVRQNDADNTPAASWGEWALVLTNKNYASQIAAGTITNAMLAGSIANNKLANSSVTVNGTSVSLGGSITTAKWGESRNINIASSDGTGASTSVSVDGSAAKTLLLPSTIKASLTGNATSATKLNTGTSTYSAWGQTYWSNGVPNSISGLLSSVSGIKINSTGSGYGYIDFHYASTAGYTSNIYEPKSGQLAINSLLYVTKGGNVGIGTDSPAQKLDVSGNIHLTGDIYLNNTKHVYFRNAANNGDVNVLALDGINQLFVGGNMTGAATYIRGKLIYLQSGTSSTTALSINENGLVEIMQNTQGLKIGNAYLVWDSANNALKVTGANSAAVNFYATGGVSALGMGDSGGGGVTLNEPLASINSSSLGSPSGHTNSTMVWNGSSWVWSNSQGVSLGAYNFSAFAGNFNTLAINNKAVATQEWVGNQGFVKLVTAKNQSYIDGTSGSYAFEGSKGTWTGLDMTDNDWAGLQVGGNNDRWQLMAKSQTLFFRQNDNDADHFSANNWGDWKEILTTANTYISGQTIIINGTSLTVPTAGGSISGTQNRLAYFSNASTLGSTGNIAYLPNTADSTANKGVQNGIRIWGATYGNSASDLVSGVVGDIRYGDGGPQIQFSTGASRAQDGALIFTDHDQNSKFPGSSFHFVSTEGTNGANTWVVSPRFHAKNTISIGDTPSTSYSLYVGGTAHVTDKLSVAGTCTLAGNVGVGTSASGTYRLCVSGSVYSSGGYYHSSYDNNYVLLAGGGAKALSEIGSGTFLPLSGGVMTGNISFRGSGSTYEMIKFKSSTDPYGQGLVLGGGGLVAIGGGESSDVMAAQCDGSNERTLIGNDGDVEIYTALQNGWNSRHTFLFNSSGMLTMDGGQSKAYQIVVTNGSSTSNYWHKLGTFVTAGNSHNIIINIYSGNGYNGDANQNSWARIILKDGWQSPVSKTNCIGITCERYGYSKTIQVRVNVTNRPSNSSATGDVWVLLPWDYANGNYTVEGNFASWTHNSTTTGDTTTAPTHNQKAVMYYDYVASTNNDAYISGLNIVSSNPAPNVYLTTIYANRTVPSGYTNSIHVDVGAGSLTSSKAWSTSSDMRLKNVWRHFDIDVNSVAKAPLFTYRLKSGGSQLMVGTSAQYWMEKIPETVTTGYDGYYSLDYNGVLTASVISVARKVVDHELRIKQLQERVLELENELKQLKAA